MMIHEFTARTGYTPTFEEYREIERQYHECEDDKDTFCANWVAYHWAREQVTNAINNALNRACKREGNTARVKALAEYLNLFTENFY